MLLQLVDAGAQGRTPFSIQEVLSVGKIAGACGILDQQIHFQNTTKLEGGEAFIYRFWLSESARLGKSLEEYSKHCNAAIDAYKRLWDASKKE